MSLLNLTLDPPIPHADQLHRAAITAMSFSPSGELLASVSEDGRLLVFSTQTGDLMDSVEMRDRAFTSVEWTSETRLLVGISTGTILVFDTLETELQCSAFRVHRSRVECLAHHRRTIASGAGPEILISTIQDNEEWHVMNALTHPESTNSRLNILSCPVTVTAIHWGPPSPQPHTSTLLAAYVHHGVSIWDIKTSTIIRTLPGTADIVIGSASLSLEKNLLVLFNAVSFTLDVYNLKYMWKTRSLGSPQSISHSAQKVPVTFTFGGRVIVGGRDKYGNPGIWQLSGETPKQILDHGFDQGDNRTISAIACHYEASTERAWMATATAVDSASDVAFRPSIHIWRAASRSTNQPFQKTANEPDMNQKVKRRRSFRRYSCYVLVFFLLYVVVLVFNTTTEGYSV